MDLPAQEVTGSGTHTAPGQQEPPQGCNANDEQCTAHGPLSQLGGEAPPQTVGELRHVLQQHSPAFASGANMDVCVGSRRLPAESGTDLRALGLDPEGVVRVCPPIRPGWQCCPLAALEDGEEPRLGLERFLTVWILLAGSVGIAVGQIPHIEHVFLALKVGKTNILTAVGMIAMLLPPFASTRYNEMPRSIARLPRRIGVVSIITNWIVGPLLMLALGLAVLFDHGEILQGVIFIGAARCIAMVLVWNALAGGDALLCVSLVLLNSVITIVAYAPTVSALGALSRLAGVHVETEVGFLMVLVNVLIYLGIPLAIGVTMWLVGHRHPAYETKFLPRFAPVGLLALLWTVLWMFAEMSPALLSGQYPIAIVALVVVPLLLYFSLMFVATWAFTRLALGLPPAQVAALSFTAASNNFELALAAATAIFGTSSPQAVATVIGPLVEIPVMLLMVKVSKCLR